MTAAESAGPSLRDIAREWGRIGCIGFGGPPVHISLLRELCVSERGWLTAEQFERAIAATNLLPGPASTQLAIYSAWRLRGRPGAIVGGLCFICPGLLVIIALSILFLAGSPPLWVRATGMGAGAAVAPVAVRAGLGVARPIWEGAAAGGPRTRTLLYGVAGGVAAATVGAWLVVVLLGCGLLELLVRGLAAPPRRLAGALALLGHRALLAADGVLATLAPSGGSAALAWTALKVGGLAFGGGFVIVPLMQGDAVGAYHWMTHAQFLNAVALGQITPGPLTQTVAAVGYAEGGIGGALLAAAVAFAPSFAFVLAGGPRFERVLSNARARAFLAGAAPAAAGAIIGSAVPLAAALSQDWQYALLAASAAALLLRRGVVPTLLAAAAAGALAGLLGAPVPG